MHFSADEIRAVISYKSLIPEMRKALIAASAGSVTQPLRTMMTLPEYGGRYGVMSAIYGEVMGTKMVSIYPENAKFNLPTHASTIQIFSTLTGQSLATLDGDVITEMRTAAVSALAMDTLAPQASSTLAILGAGVQARAHLSAMLQIRDFDTIYVWNRHHSRANLWSTQAKVLAKKTVKEAVESADVVVTATNASSPILHGNFLKTNSLVIAVGAVHPQMRELDDAVMDGVVIVESREAAQNESGDVILSGASIYAELGEILAGSTALPVSSRRVFKSVGIAVEDVAAAYLAYTHLKVSTEAGLLAASSRHNM